jgi:hypothetical protein
VVQVVPEGARTTNETIDSRVRVEVAEDLDAGLGRQASTARAGRSRSSWARIVSTPTASLSWKTSPARIDSMIAGVPPSSRWLGSVEVAVVVGVDVGDRAAAGHIGHPVA